MRTARLGATIFVAMLLAACGSSGGGSTTSRPPVTVKIGIEYVGGPAPGHPGTFAPGTIHLKGSGVDSSTTVADRHTATFRVQPGDYTATARSGDAQCRATKLHAVTGMQSPVVVRCDVR